MTTTPPTPPSREAAEPVGARRWIAWLRQHWRLGWIALAGVVIGWGGFATWITVIEYTNNTSFCINCHVMKDTVYKEYLESSHYKNKFGVHVGCPDCHVPQYNWIDEAHAKFGSVIELYRFVFEGMSNVDNFEKKRPELAAEVWEKFKETNARECRHCHDYDNMTAAEQSPSARNKHADAAKTNENCVECHKGITHKNYEKKAAAPAPTDFDVQ